MIKKNNPGCPCCERCVIFRDDFNRADSSSLGSDWTEVDGDWSIASNKLTVAVPESLAIAKAAITVTAANGGDVTLDEFAVLATVQSDTEGDKLGVMIGHTDANNMTYCLVTIHNTAAKIQIAKVTAGTTTLSAEDEITAPTNTPIVVRLCQSFGPFMTAYVDDVAVCKFAQSKSGATCAGVVANATGAVTFSEVRAEESWSESTTCPDCAACSTELTALDSFTAARSFYESGSSWTFTGSRRRSTGNGGETTHLKCWRTSILPSPFTIVMETQWYWSGGTRFPLLTAWTGGSGGSLEIIRFGVIGSGQYQLTASGASPVTFGSVASGDIGQLHITETALDVVQIKGYINGVLGATINGVNWAVRDQVNFRMGVAAFSGFGGVVTHYAEFDYFETTIA